jgi:hypothetical protein
MAVSGACQTASPDALPPDNISFYVSTVLETHTLPVNPNDKNCGKYTDNQLV